MIGVEEQETTVNIDRKGDFASVYTSDTTMMRKLDRLVEVGDWELVSTIKDSEGMVCGKTYRSSKSLISFRSKVTKREMTEEQRQALGERLKESRKKNV